MLTINHTPSSATGMASILDLPSRDKRELGSRLNNNLANGQVNPQDQIQKEKQLDILSNNNETQHNNDTLNLTNQFIN
ncbi:MAG TPA: hypothetical protein ACHBX0_02370 [Arsenophonus sp.]